MAAYFHDAQTLSTPKPHPSAPSRISERLPTTNRPNRATRAARPSVQSTPLGREDLFPMLAALHREDDAFQQAAQIQRYAMGEQVASPEMLEQRMLILVEGRVNLVCTSPTRRQLVISTLEPGAIFGRGGLYGGSDINVDDSNVFAVAAADVVIWDIAATEARQLSIQHPILTWGLLQTHSERLSQVQKNLESVACKKLPERLAELLLQLGHYRNGPIEGYCHQTLANYLGTYRETVSAALREFKRRGLIKIGYCRLEVLQVEQLKEIAGVWE